MSTRATSPRVQAAMQIVRVELRRRCGTLRRTHDRWETHEWARVGWSLDLRDAAAYELTEAGKNRCEASGRLCLFAVDVQR